MTTLAKTQPRDYAAGFGDLMLGIPMVATDIVYEGAAVGDAAGAGTARPLVAGDDFLGFAWRKADNLTGVASAINCLIRPFGLVKLSVTGVTGTTDIGKPVFASDDATFTLTRGTSTEIGVIAQWISTTYALVHFRATSWGGGRAGASPGMLQTVGQTLGDVSASNDHFLFIAPCNLKIINVQFVTETTDAIDATDFWTFQIANLTDSVNLMAAVVTNETGGTAITADTPYDLTPDQNQDVNKGDVLELQMVKAASATTLAAAACFIHYVPETT